MNNSRIYRRFAVVAIGLLLAGLVPSSVLAVGTVYVRPLVTPGGGSCDSPEYNSIQLAVNGTEAGSTIHICAGTYNLTGSIEVEEKPGDTFVGDAGAILDGAAIVEVNGKKSIIWSDSDITIVDLTFQNGSAASGGAVSAPANAVSVRGSTFVNNAATAGAGGAISAATVAISNSTFSGNSATGAGGAVAAATGSIVNVTFVGNTSVTGATAVSSTTSMTVTNSILADASSNCGGAGTFTDGGGNLSTDTSCTGFAGNSTSLASLHLGALANNDGPTQTIALDMALGANSVAINDGVDAVCTASPVNGLDQRGETRPSGAHCDSGAFEATLGAFHHLTISPINATITAGGSQVYAAEGYDSLGNDLGDRTSTSDFTIDGSPCTGASCTSTLVGAHTVTASNHADSSIQISTTLHVTHGTLFSLAIAPTNQTIAEGQNESYSATGTDTYSNHWDATSDSTFSISPTPGSSCTSGPSPTCTSIVATDHTVTATDDTIQISTTLHVTHGTLVLLTIAPADQTIGAGGSQAYTAQGADDPGNRWDATGSSDFTITGAGSSCTVTTCTSTVPGDHTVTATDKANTSVSNSTTLHVTVGALHHLVLSPSSATIAVSGSQSYTAAGYDAYGNPLGDVTGSTTFTIGGASSSCTGTSCTSTLSGDHTVTGTDGAATGTATLHVSAGAATHLSVVGPTSPRAVDASGNVTVTALDAYENTATGYAGTVHFTSSDANATLPANGTLTSGVGTFSVAFGTVGTQSVTASRAVRPASSSRRRSRPPITPSRRSVSSTRAMARAAVPAR
jgi:predicted outer membrane repeat protein